MFDLTYSTFVMIAVSFTNPIDEICLTADDTFLLIQITHINFNMYTEMIQKLNTTSFVSWMKLLFVLFCLIFLFIISK